LQGRCKSLPLHRDLRLELILANLFNGISYASILFLIASGLSLVFGVMGVINLAHGALYMLGAYIGITVGLQTNNFLIAAIGATVGLAIIGLIVERVFLGRLYKMLDQQALLTLGLVYVFSNVALWIWGPYPVTGHRPAFLTGTIPIGDYNFLIYRFGLIFIGLVLFFGMWWLQDKTRIGARVRAGMDNKNMTMSLGINYALIATAIFILGAAMGGLAGYLGSPILGAEPEMSMPILLLAMIIVVIGGLGSIQGALIGSLIIGIINTFGNVYFQDFAMFTSYLIFIIVLIVRPTGLLGRKRT
jgi:branched-chain amino acid transport system permease protein